VDVILVAVGFLALTTVGALVRHDSVHWAIALGRLMVMLAARLQTEAEREFQRTEAELEALASETVEGRRAITSVLKFAAIHLARQVPRSVARRLRPRQRTDRSQQPQTAQGHDEFLDAIGRLTKADMSTTRYVAALVAIVLVRPRRRWFRR
jgi:hypothetical protein